MPVNTAGLNKLVAGIKDGTGLTLVALAGTSTIDSAAVTFAAGATGVIDITANATLTIDSGVTVSSVRLIDSTTSVVASIASETLITDNVFPNGGDLIITSFKITVA